MEEWIRILIDGYNLLHRQREIAPDHPPHTPQARHRLIRRLTRFQDASAIPLVVVFDGRSRERRECRDPAYPHLEVIFSPAGLSADAVIEKLTEGYRSFGKVLVISDDFAERSTVDSLGGTAMSTRYLMDEMREADRRLGERLRPFRS